MEGHTSQVTRLLQLASEGRTEAHEQLLPIVYGELRQLAAAQMRRERAGHTFAPTDLVHEAYVRLLRDEAPRWENSAHFYGCAAEAMRRILIERARRKKRLCHGGGRRRIELAETLALDLRSDPAAVIAPDDAIETLGRMDQRMVELVKLRCFLGMTIAQAATVLGVSARTLDRDWVVARAWLGKELAADR